MREKNIVISFQDLINKSATILSETVSFNTKEVINTTINFIKYRFKNMLLSAGINQDIIDAVISIVSSIKQRKKSTPYKNSEIFLRILKC